MKKILLICFLFTGFHAFSQSDLRLNLLGGVDYNFSKYTYPEDGTSNDFIDFEMPLGYTFRGELEWAFSEKLSISSGLSYSKRVFKPRLNLGFWYGTRLGEGENAIYMASPYLATHTFHLLSLPISIKRYYRVNEKNSFYTTLGGMISFKLQEKETYKDMFNTGENVVDGWADHFSDTDKGFGLFSTSVEIGFGWQYQLKKDLHLIVQTNANILEYRKANEKFKKNNELLWKDTFVPLSQLSISLGIQKTL